MITCPICTVHSFDLFLLCVSPKLSRNILVTLYCGKSSVFLKDFLFHILHDNEPKSIVGKLNCCKINGAKQLCLLTYHIRDIIKQLTWFANVSAGHEFMRITLHMFFSSKAKAKSSNFSVICHWVQLNFWNHLILTPTFHMTRHK